MRTKIGDASSNWRTSVVSLGHIQFPEARKQEAGIGRTGKAGEKKEED